VKVLFCDTNALYATSCHSQEDLQHNTPGVDTEHWMNMFQDITLQDT